MVTVVRNVKCWKLLPFHPQRKFARRDVARIVQREQSIPQAVITLVTGIMFSFHRSEVARNALLCVENEHQSVRAPVTVVEFDGAETVAVVPKLPFEVPQVTASNKGANSPIICDLQFD